MGFKTKYDKTNASSLTKTIDINKNITLKHSENNKNITSNLKIKKVSFSPLGNIINIEQVSNNEKINLVDSDFLLLDNENNYLNIINEYELNDNNKATTSFEFLAPNTDISSIKIVPIDNIYHAPVTDTELYDLDNVPSSISLGESSTLQIDNIKRENNEISIKFHFNDYADTASNELPCFFYDKDNNPINARGYLRHNVDRSNNTFTATYGYYTEKDFSKVSKIRFNINNRYKINYDNAITVDLK